jgi:hypothetical protein
MRDEERVRSPSVAAASLGVWNFRVVVRTYVCVSVCMYIRMSVSLYGWVDGWMVQGVSGDVVCRDVFAGRIRCL